MDELHFSQRPHDALFRAMFGDPANAGELLRNILPEKITQRQPVFAFHLEEQIARAIPTAETLDNVFVD